MGVLVSLPEVLHNAKSSVLFLWNAENGWVIEWVWSLNNPQFQPFIQCLFDELVVGFWNLELFPVDWVLCFEVDFVLKILGEPQVILVNAESVLVFAQDIQIMFMKFLWHLKVTPFSRTGSQNSEFQRRYIRTEGKNLWTNCRLSSSSYSTSYTQKRHRHIHSAMLKWKCFTKKWKSSYNLS